MKWLLHVCDPQEENRSSFFFNKDEFLLQHIFRISKQLLLQEKNPLVYEIMIVNY